MRVQIKESASKRLMGRHITFSILILLVVSALAAQDYLYTLMVKAPAGSKVVAVLSGGNVNLEQLRGLRWN